MKRKIKVLLMFSLLTLLLTATALATGDYQIAWWTVDGGGGNCQSADEQYTLSGTVGQPDASFASGGEYAFHGGFWQGIGAAIREFLIHLPLVHR